MDSNGPAGRVTSSTGDVDLDGALVGRVRENGAALGALPWNERPGFYERMEAAGQDPEAMRKLIAAGGAVSAC